MIDVGLVTYSGRNEQTPDDYLLTLALEALGLTVEHPAWDDPGVAWGDFGMLVIRSTWNYHLRRDDFLAWTCMVSQATRLWNPPDVIEWNSHKGYLRELSDKGVGVVPTVWLERGTRASLGDIMRAEGWDRVVVKPAVSAAACHTMRVDGTALERGQAHLESGLASGDMMIQLYLESVATEHERSLIFLADEFSHAVRRAPVLDLKHESEFQPNCVEARSDEMALARRALYAASSPLLYARVDIARDAEGTPVLMELELVEPYLFLERAAGSAEMFARAIASQLS